MVDADLVVEVRAPEGGGRSAVVVAGGRILELVEGDHAVDAARRGAEHLVVEGVVAPLFVDTHNHLLLTARNALGVPMREARSIADVVDRVRERAAVTPPGSWVQTAADWHEMQLAERRLPTALELDAATTDHPVLVQRGGHNGVLNSAALAVMAPDLAGPLAAHLGRDDGGAPTGSVHEEALAAVLRRLPPVPRDTLVASIDATSRAYRDLGIGVVRDPAVSVEEWQVLRQARAEGRLHVRTHAMVFSPAGAIAAAGSADGYLDGLEAQGLRPGAGDDLLRLWGIKLVLDGGVEAAAVAEPYANAPEHRGTLLMTAPQLDDVLSACVRRGWPVGAHAVGEVAVDQFLDAVAQAGPHRPGQLVLEHAALIGPAQIARAVDLDVHITAQQALRDTLVGPFTEHLGPARVARMFPWRSLVDGGASVSAGTDHPIGALAPLAGVLGMTTRATRLGVLGVEHAVTRAEALDLYTVAGARLIGAPLTGAVTEGAPADFAVYPVDPRTADDDAFAQLTPALTVLAGEVQHSPA